MLFFFDSQGRLLKDNPQTIYQGSNKANTLNVVAPFSATCEMTAQFILPNGDILDPLVMTKRGAINELTSTTTATTIDDRLCALWELNIPSNVTKYKGKVYCNLTLYMADDIVTFASVEINIQRGTIGVLPATPTTTIYQQILSEIGKINNNKQDKIDELTLLYKINSDGEYKFYIGDVITERDKTTDGKWKLTLSEYKLLKYNNNDNNALNYIILRRLEETSGTLSSTTDIIKLELADNSTSDSKVIRQYNKLVINGEREPQTLYKIIIEPVYNAEGELDYGVFTFTTLLTGGDNELSITIESGTTEKTITEEDYKFLIGKDIRYIKLVNGNNTIRYDFKYSTSAERIYASNEKGNDNFYGFAKYLSLSKIPTTTTEGNVYKFTLSETPTGETIEFNPETIPSGTEVKNLQTLMCGDKYADVSMEVLENAPAGITPQEMRVAKIRGKYYNINDDYLTFSSDYIAPELANGICRLVRFNKINSEGVVQEVKLRFAGGGSGTGNYADLENMPKLNYVLIKGGNNTFEDLNLYSRDDVDDKLKAKITVKFVDALPTQLKVNYMYYVKVDPTTPGGEVTYNVYLTDYDESTPPQIQVHDLGNTKIDLTDYQKKVDNNITGEEKNLVLVINSLITQLAKKTDKISGDNVLPFYLGLFKENGRYLFNIQYTDTTSGSVSKSLQWEYDDRLTTTKKTIVEAINELVTSLSGEATARATSDLTLQASINTKQDKLPTPLAGMFLHVKDDLSLEYSEVKALPEFTGNKGKYLFLAEDDEGNLYVKWNELVIDVTKAYVDTQDTALDNKIKEKEEELNTKISEEQTRASGREDQLNYQITEETTRATTKENELETSINSKAGKDEVVKLTGDQTIAGTKKFTSPIKVASNSTAYPELTIASNGLVKAINASESYTLSFPQKTGVIAIQGDLDKKLDKTSVVSAKDTTGIATNTYNTTYLNNTFSGKLDVTTSVNKIVAMTKAQFDALTTKDTRTLYNVTGESTSQDIIKEFYNIIYPVNSIVFGFQAPGAPPGVTWTDVSASYNGRYFKVDSSNAVGTTQAEQLPNIKGGYDAGSSMWYLTDSASGTGTFGAFKLTNTTGGMSDVSGGARKWTNFGFNANRSNSVYQDGGAVRPLTTTIKVWKRTV